MSADPNSIRNLAYQLWEERGRPDGSAEQDWSDAESQLTESVGTSSVDDSLKDTFPASDPPASRLPDEPPVNAQAKWNASAKSRRSR